MKRLFIAAAILMTMALGVSNSAKAQVTLSDPNVALAANNLINVQVPIDISNVTVQDVVDVTDVLNNNDVTILRDFLNNLSIDNVLNNLLRDADIITGNEVVVGVVLNVLGGVEQVLVADRALFGNKKPKK